jgi:hypothetical protein
MNATLRQSRGGSPLVESLEDRRLFSVAVPATALDAPTPVAASAAFAYVRPVFVGRAIHAITDQPFRAVVGMIRTLRPLPPGYSFQGEIDWGDGTEPSAARFVRQAGGLVAVLGGHAYAKPGGFVITVTVSVVPPPWSEAPVRLLGAFRSKAEVFAANGGVTLNEPAGVEFTARVGFFRATQPAETLRAVIDWGDGTRSLGKIVVLPTAGIVPTYAVEGAHRYDVVASYHVRIAVFSEGPTPTADPTDVVPPVVLVAQIDSVIDVLPPVLTTTTTA